MANTLSIARIKGDPNNIRTKVSVKDLGGLAESIKSIGLQQPIVVRPHEDGYMVIAGHRRLAAIGTLVDAGDHTGELVLDRDVILRAEDMTDADITVSQLVENLQREDIDVLDEAAGYMRLLEFDMSQADIARKVGRSRAHITKRLALLSLPEKARKALAKGEITIEHALNIAALDAEDAAAFCEGDIHNTHTLLRFNRQQKGKKVATKFGSDLAATGLTVVTSHDEVEVPEGKRLETIESQWSDSWDGSVPEDSDVAIVEVNGEHASARIYRFVDDTAPDKAADKEAKAKEREKAKKREERLAEQRKMDFLSRQLERVKAADAQDIALSMTLDRLGYANAREVCVLLDLEVPVKETTTYDGKVRNEKQYYPLVSSMVREARENGDIGFLRRVVLAIACTYGYKEQLLTHFGYDPEAETATEADG